VGGLFLGVFFFGGGGGGVLFCFFGLLVCVVVGFFWGVGWVGVLFGGGVFWLLTGLAAREVYSGRDRLAIHQEI